MNPATPPVPCPALAGFPAPVVEAYQRYRATGDVGAVEEVVIAAAVDHRPGSKDPAPQVSDRTRLLEDLAYDSVSVAELVFFLEDLFDLTISTEDIEAAKTIGDLRSCVVRKLAGKSAAA
jgi:acyl carrier protein